MAFFTSEQATKIFEDQFAEQAVVARETCALLGPAFLEVLGAWTRCIEAGGKIMFFGNGGSASQAQHIATELAVRYKADRKAIAAIALNSDTALITAAANDLGFDQIFARQIEALGRPGDLAFGLSTSGRSPNVLRALEVARAMGLVTVALTAGDGGTMASLADFSLVVPSRVTARVQEMHLTLGHMLCVGVERALGLA